MFIFSGRWFDKSCPSIFLKNDRKIGTIVTWIFMNMMKI